MRGLAVAMDEDNELRRVGAIWVLTGAILVVILVTAFTGVPLSSAAPEPPPGSLTRLDNLTFVCGGLLAGFLLALVLFLNFDEDMKGLKTLLVGAVSGLTLTNARPILEKVSRHYSLLTAQSPQDRWLGFLTFLSLTSGLLGFVGGFLVIRLRLEGAFASARSAVGRYLDSAPDPPSLPWVEAREFWLEKPGEMPDAKTLAKITNVKDWSALPPEQATRAGGVLLKAKRHEAAFAALKAALASEPPSPAAFDFYAAALAETASGKFFDEATLRDVERTVARMLTYWPDSYLVNVDAGYLYLYASGKARLARHYSERALNVRPNSKSASFNLACALAAELGPRAPTDEEVKPIVRALDIALSQAPGWVERIEKEDDFVFAKQNKAFADWLSERKAGPAAPSAGMFRP